MTASRDDSAGTKRQVRKECTRKLRHGLRAGAEAHIADIAKAKDELGLVAYPCAFCEGWHVGHPKRG